MGRQPADGEDRRQFLKRAGAVAGATVWAVPTMQVVRMASAGAQTTGSVVVTNPPPSTSEAPRPSTVETISFTGHVNRTNPCNGERVEGPETTTVVVETFETSVDVLVVVHVSLEGDQLFDESGNRYSISVTASGTFTSQMDQYVFVGSTEDWIGDGAPDFQALGATHRVPMVDGRPVSHNFGGGSDVCLG